MKIIETTYTVNHTGSLKIPAMAIQAMGLIPGSHVRVAYLSKDGEENTFQEFFLSPTGFEIASEAAAIAVPNALLHQANLDETSDIQILCLNGCILICRDAGLKLDELAEILDRLDIANDLSKLLPDDVKLAQQQLDAAIEAWEKGADTYAELYGSNHCSSAK